MKEMEEKKTCETCRYFTDTDIAYHPAICGRASFFVPVKAEQNACDRYEEPEEGKEFPACSGYVPGAEGLGQ